MKIFKLNVTAKLKKKEKIHLNVTAIHKILQKLKKKEKIHLILIQFKIPFRVHKVIGIRMLFTRFHKKMIE